jgi:hypothetical protein
MTRRPRKAKVMRKVVHKGKPARLAKRPQHDPLDDFIIASARALDLKIDTAWMPAVRGNLAVTLRLAALVSAFTLPDDAELAPVFEA